MSALSPAYIRQSRGDRPTGSPAPLVHEDPAQSIQGGTTNEHYHLTAAEHSNVDTIPSVTTRLTTLEGIVATGPKIFEPMASVNSIGSLMFTVVGDVMVAWDGHYVT